MPVLTYDLVFGTQKVKFLNLSHNVINEIRRSKCTIIKDFTYNLQIILQLEMTTLLIFNNESISTLVTDALSNLTQLKTLDLSFNEIETLDTIDFKFNFPINLTELHITNNQLQQLPMHVFKNVSTMTFIDIQNNSIVSFDADLLRNVKNGLQLFISGNYFFSSSC